MTWHLESAEARNDRHHATFQIPARSLRESLRVNDLVKLIFHGSTSKGGPAAERMWVEISSRSSIVNGQVEYRGRLRNEPAFISGLKLDDEIVFGPEHVASVQR